jgi:hypothetical protein
VNIHVISPALIIVPRIVIIIVFIALAVLSIVFARDDVIGIPLDGPWLVRVHVVHVQTVALSVRNPILVATDFLVLVLITPALP